ncbi:MAG: hypothetical protein K2J14_01930, partial [Treponemataceae bacterium]|nr:hypothetical protein [Treponemataceae bacterium]
CTSKCACCINGRTDNFPRKRGGFFMDKGESDVSATFLHSFRAVPLKIRRVCIKIVGKRQRARWIAGSGMSGEFFVSATGLL